MIEMYGFKASYAHCAVEAKPPVEWNKGEAALHILRSEFGDDWYKKATVMFMGDDTTDEDAMKVIICPSLGHGFYTLHQVQFQMEISVEKL